MNILPGKSGELSQLHAEPSDFPIIGRKSTIVIIGRKPNSNDSPASNVEATIKALADALKNNLFNVVIKSEAQSFHDVAKKQPIIVIVVGGDGTMLDAARNLAKYGIPLIGVNQGRLGFITDVPKDKAVETVIDMLGGKEEHFLETRSLIDTIIGECNVGQALNEIVISQTSGRVIEFNVLIDQKFAFSSRGDGLMIITPTGSTAYSLAAGGSIISPVAKVFEVIPMMPQTLSYRPLIINDTSRVEMELVHGEAKVFIDGNEVEIMKAGDILLAQKAKEQAIFMHPYSYDYYNTLRTKLGWQSVPGEKR